MTKLLLLLVVLAMSDWGEPRLLLIARPLVSGDMVAEPCSEPAVLLLLFAALLELTPGFWSKVVESTKSVLLGAMSPKALAAICDCEGAPPLLPPVPYVA